MWYSGIIRRLRAKMSRPLAIPFTCLFLVMLGFSVTLAVLPSRLGRVVLGPTPPPDATAFHVGALTGVYALAQFIAAPLWGRWSDRHGRRTALLWSLSGFSASQILCGFATGLPFLYAGRILGGAFSGAMFPIAAGSVAAALPGHRQAQGMAWLSASAALGVVAGPILGGMSARQSWSWDTPVGRVAIDGFAAPFLALTVISAVMIAIVLLWRAESPRTNHSAARHEVPGWTSTGLRMRGLLMLVFASQVAMALFMTAFALYADARLRLGPGGIGAVFALCGLITASVQLGAIWLLARRWGEWAQVGMGFGAMGVGLAALPLAPALSLAAVAVGIFVVGSAIVAPSLLSLSTSDSPDAAGMAAGLVGSATYLGQVAGPLAASVLFVLDAAAPFYAASLLTLAAAAWVVWRYRSERHCNQEVDE
jgi:DHA1 family multidrug resistance protein-like MFS transporter